MARFVRDLNVLPAAHALISEQYETCLCLFQLKLVLILLSPEGWQAESTKLADCIPTHLKAVTHPRAN